MLFTNIFKNKLTTYFKDKHSDDFEVYLIVLICCIILFDLILNVPSTIFPLNRDVSSRVEPVLSFYKCVLLKDHNTVTLVRLETLAPRSRVKHSTTEPLRSLICCIT